MDHESYRAFSGAGEVSWVGRLPKSGLESFALIEDLVFGVKFDNQLRKAAQTGSIVENVFEFADVKEKWDEITAQLQDEESERQAAQGLGDETARERRRIRLPSSFFARGRRISRRTVSSTGGPWPIRLSGRTSRS